MSADWHKVASAADVPAGGALQVSVGSELIALYNLEGRFYATADVCTHRYALLSQGYIEGDTVECPLHQGRFHIPTGKALCDPADIDLKTYAVKEQDGSIYIEV